MSWNAEFIIHMAVIPPSGCDYFCMAGCFPELQAGADVVDDRPRKHASPGISGNAPLRRSPKALFFPWWTLYPLYLLYAYILLVS